MKNQALPFHCDVGQVSASNHAQTQRIKNEKKVSVCLLAFNC